MSDVPSRLSITPHDDGQTLVLVGEIDAHTSPDLADQLAELPGGAGDITIDMSDVEFIDSSGLRVIIDVHQRAEEVDRRLVLRSPSSAVARLVEIAGLADHLHVIA
jgi:anti-sigma B factor antagonist